MIQKKTLGYLLIFILILNFLDAITTHYALSNGISKEYNPSMAYIINVLGLDNAMIFKIVVGFFAVVYITLICVFLYKKYQTCDYKKKKAAIRCIISTYCMSVFLVIVMSFVVIGNIFVIFGIMSP